MNFHHHPIIFNAKGGTLGILGAYAIGGDMPDIDCCDTVMPWWWYDDDDVDEGETLSEKSAGSLGLRWTGRDETGQDGRGLLCFMEEAMRLLNFKLLIKFRSFSFYSFGQSKCRVCVWSSSNYLSIKTKQTSAIIMSVDNFILVNMHKTL